MSTFVYFFPGFNKLEFFVEGNHLITRKNKQFIIEGIYGFFDNKNFWILFVKISLYNHKLFSRFLLSKMFVHKFTHLGKINLDEHNLGLRFEFF